MILLFDSLHRFEKSLDELVIALFEKNTTIAILFMIVGFPICILAILFLIALVFLPFAYMLV